MSAFLCNADHIGEMSKFFANGSVPMSSNDLVTHCYNMVTKKRISFSSPRDVAGILANENVKSLQARYDDSWQFFFTGAGDEPFHDSLVGLYVRGCKDKTEGYPRINSKQLYGMIKCYRYQACEHEDWVSSDAYWLTQSLLSNVSSKLIGNIDTWEYRPKEDVA